MSCELAPPSDLSAQVQSPLGLREFVVRRRLVLSRLLFVALVTTHLCVMHSQPRDVTNWADPLGALSVALILAGLAIRSWAAGTLHKGRKLATTGPYAWTRNPLYAGSGLMIIGFVLLLNGSALVWLALAPLIAIYWQSIKNEERHLSTLFPEEWPEYAASVPRFLPRRLSWPRLESGSLSQWLHNEEYQAVLGSAVGLVGIKAWHLWV